MVRRWGRWLAPPLVAPLLLLGTATAAHAGYQGTVAVNDTAFTKPCLGFESAWPDKMYAAARDAFVRLGYATGAYTGAPFTKALILARTPSDWGFYVHSHGDRYYNADGRYYSGFRDDAGRCSGSVVYSKEIAAKRLGRQSNLVLMSACHLGESTTTMPGAFAIEMTKARQLQSNGPEFYVGYVGDAWDSDEATFEQRFWDALGTGTGVGYAFDAAYGAGGWRHPFGADWWGTYYWSGRAGPITTQCPYCV
ncbi:MAG TPA: hypothetical protein VEY67_12610 [Candidatus Dormibacteraeota bacterium]|nr:hypothetical protein [Candidatus Dormibacteraeota bacterium]